MAEQAGRSIRLPPTARSTTQARRFVLSALSDWGLDALRDTAALLTSEVVTNSVLHARTDVEVSIARHDEGVVVEVSDGSRRAPVRRLQLDEATTGRGVELLEQLAASWDVTLHSDGKTVRFSLSEAVDPWAAYTGSEWAKGLHP
ncbi:MAG TPA: ATP-binding protein [Mycobacteriales bacterium]|nr:ATP-binding protein [Mycobacteriales bacterium]